jgi:hypothetical protein
VALVLPGSTAAAAVPPRSSGGTGGVAIKVMDVPAARIADPRALEYIVDYVDPGLTIHRHVLVSNTSADRLRVDLYAAAATVEDNSFTGADGRLGNDLSSWVSMGAASLDLAAATAQPVSVTIAVPPSAIRGEHYAAIWASIAGPPAAAGGIRQINRVGVRVYLDVGPGGEPASDFQIDGMALNQTGLRWPVVSAEVHNTGGRALDLTGTLRMSDADGIVNAGPFPVDNGVTILPGHTARVGAPVDKALSPGRWTAQLTLTSGTVQHKATATLALLPPGDSHPAVAGPWTTLALRAGGVAGLAVLTVVAILLGHRKRVRART